MWTRKPDGLCPLALACAVVILTGPVEPAAAGSGLVGVGHPDMSFGSLVAGHDPSLGPLIGVDVFANAGPAFKSAAVTANPGGDFAKVDIDGLPLLTFSNGNDPMTTYGIQDLRASTKFMANGVHTIRSKLLLEQGGISASKSISAGGGALAQYAVADSLSMIDLQFNLMIGGSITIPDTRTNAVFSVGVSFAITDISGAPITVQTGVWQGGHGSDFTLGLLNMPGITTSLTDTGDAHLRSIAGDHTWTVSIPNNSLFNLEWTAFYSLSGPPGEAADNIYINLGDTVELTFGLAPGFEDAQLILVPEPSAAPLLATLGLLATIRRERRSAG